MTAAQQGGRLQQAAVAPVATSVDLAERTGKPFLTPGRVVFVVLLVGLSVLFLFPFVWLVSASLKERAQVFNGNLMPNPIVFENYAKIWEVAPVLQWLANSLIAGVLAAVTVTFSSALTAFAFAYFRFPFRNLLFGVVLATMMLPGAVTLVPTYLIWNSVGKVVPAAGIDTLTPLWAGNLFGSAFYIFLLRQFFLSLPRELFEAAKVDGAGYFRMFRSIAIPLTIPALIVVLIFEFKASWTDFLKPLIYLQSVDHFTMPLGLKTLVDKYSLHGGLGDIQYVMAATVVVTLPLIVIFFVGQRYFVEGIATTGRKG